MLDALFQNEAWFQDVQYQLASAKLMKALRIVRLGRAYPELVSVIQGLVVAIKPVPMASRLIQGA